jgi:hypothetical protein
VGVPAVSYGGSDDYIGRPADCGMKQHQGYAAHDYHKPFDMLELGYNVAQSGENPQWKGGFEFKARRDAMMITAQ